MNTREELRWYKPTKENKRVYIQLGHNVRFIGELNNAKHNFYILHKYTVSKEGKPMFFLDTKYFVGGNPPEIYIISNPWDNKNLYGYYIQNHGVVVKDPFINTLKLIEREEFYSNNLKSSKLKFDKWNPSYVEYKIKNKLY